MYRKYYNIFCIYLFKNEQTFVVGMGGIDKYNEIHISNIQVFVCLLGVSRHTREFFNHLETSQLQVKGIKL